MKFASWSTLRHAYSDIKNRLEGRVKKEDQASADGDEYLSKAEVMELFGVCDTTLWHWANSNYLKPVKAGRKFSIASGMSCTVGKK